MTERTAPVLHLLLASLGIVFLFALLLLLVPPTSTADDPAARLAEAEAERADAEGLRGSLLAWVGAGLAIGASIGVGIGALILLRRESRRLEEGR